jgi:NAD(P)-dependent dehydrogenase (short-subunit alcohol dehydrogenase family)
MNQLQGKVAIVTGGASGIGSALAEELALRGCEVVLADRQLDLARKVEERIHDRGGKAVSVELDVRDFKEFERLAKDTATRTRRIDFLFNNAGIAIGGELEPTIPKTTTTRST